MKKIVLTFGLISGSIIMILMLFTLPDMMEEMSQEDMVKGMLIGYSTMIIALSVIFVGVKSYRDKHNNGNITFGKAFQIGLYISLIACAMYGLGWEIYIMKENMNIQELIQSGQGYPEWYNITILRFLFTMCTEMLPVGLLISLISAAILRKKEVLPANQ